MPHHAITLDTKQVAQDFTLTVTMDRAKIWRWRLAVGGWLIRLAAWVMWMDIEFKTDGDK